jgi:sugar diacid utilization regulator
MRFETTDLQSAEFSRFFAPVSTGRSVLGYLEIIEGPAPITGLALRAVEYGTTVLALELLKQRAVLQAEQQLRGSFLDDLLAGTFESDEAIVRRASFVGFDLGSRYRVLALGLDPIEGEDHRRPTSSIDSIRQRLESVVATSCKVRFPGAAVILKGDTVAVLWPEAARESDGAAALETARALANDVSTALRGLTVSVGIGSTCSMPRDFAQGFAEARYCVDLLHRFGSGGQVLAMETLGLHRFLLHAQQDEQLLAFAHQKLDRLLAHSDRRGKALLETLACYFRTGCSLTRTAEDMVLHVNTVQYRIQRIEHLTDTALATPEGLMELQLALLLASLSPREFPALTGAAVSSLHAAVSDRPNPGPRGGQRGSGSISGRLQSA